MSGIGLRRESISIGLSPSKFKVLYVRQKVFLRAINQAYPNEIETIFFSLSSPTANLRWLPGPNSIR